MVHPRLAVFGSVLLPVTFVAVSVFHFFFLYCIIPIPQYTGTLYYPIIKRKTKPFSFAKMYPTNPFSLSFTHLLHIFPLLKSEGFYL